MTQSSQHDVSQRRTISQREFRADPARYILASETLGPILVVDDQGKRRFVLSSPLVDETPAAE